MKDKFEAEIGNLNSEMGAIKKMLETFLKQNATNSRNFDYKSTADSNNTTNFISITESSAQFKAATTKSSSTSDSILQPISNSAGRKLELPIFDDKDPHGWIMRAEIYFLLNRLTGDEQIEVAIISFNGNALHWFQWEHRRQTIYDWRTLKALMLKQFRSCTVGSLCKQF
ncbi:hypothetical protein LXL04_039064 [Taraxacum kok-saghyz]